VLHPRWIAVLLVVVVLATFARAVPCDFVLWDDYETVAANKQMTPPSWAGVAHYWTHTYMDLYVPVLYTLWSAVAAMAAVRVGPDVLLDPRYFHAANLLVHAASALVAFALLRRLLRPTVPPDDAAPPSGGATDLAAAVGALLFAIHPVQVEPVTWVSGMKDVLFGLCVLVALWQYVRHVEDGPAGGRFAYALATAALVLGMLSKPTAMVTPLLAGVVHVLVLRRDARSAVKPLAAWFALAAACAVWTKLAQPATHVDAVPLALRPVVMLDALAFYLWKLAWPAGMAVDYGRTPAVMVEQGWAWWTWVAPAAVAAALAWWWRRNRGDARVIVAAAALFVGAMLPVLGLVPFDFQALSTVSNRYLYLPMFGAALAAGWCAARATARWGPRAAGGMALALVAALGPVSAREIGTWQDTETLFARNLEVNPRSYLAHTNQASYANMLGTIEEFRAGVADATGARADAAAHRAAAVACYETMLTRTSAALAIRPGHSMAIELRGAALLNLGRTAEALDLLHYQVTQWEQYPLAYRKYRPGCLDLYGQALLRTGRPADARAAFEKLLAIRPDHVGARHGLADATAALAKAAAPQAPQATVEQAPLAP
jgi:hypothetical protein